MIKDENDIDFFLTTRSRLFTMYKEISEMSKKKPDNPMNQFKLTLINSIVNDINSILKDEHRPFTSFVNFDEDDLPTNSDITVVLSQYKTAMANFQRSNSKDSNFTSYWVIDGKMSAIRTT